MQYLVKNQQLLTSGKLTYNENLFSYAVLELNLQTDKVFRSVKRFKSTSLSDILEIGDSRQISTRLT